MYSLDVLSYLPSLIIALSDGIIAPPFLIIAPSDGIIEPPFPIIAPSDDIIAPTLPYYCTLQRCYCTRQAS